jgi:predicted O-linked N-acetylglucosamine transferase (SPINDLY family)
VAGVQSKDAIVHGELPHEAYRERLNQCDLFLSPFPYGNMNSIIDCFELGLPGVCLDGAEPHSRADGAFFARIGLPKELVAQTIEDYVEAAVRLIEDGEWRAYCRTIVTNADLDAAFLTGNARLFCTAIEDLISSRTGAPAEGGVPPSQNVSHD